MITQRRYPSSRRQVQRGFSLIELMVSMTIGLFLLGAVGIIYLNTASTSRSSTLESQMNEDAALALELLQQQIRLVGFSNVDNTGDRLFPGQAVRGCDGGFTNNAGGSAFNALACNAAGAGPDAIAIRYQATLLNSQPVTSGGVQFPGNCALEALAQWDATGEGSTSNNIALADNRYYIADDMGTPSLWCQGRTGAGFGTATALIPNIEDMQVEYAVTFLPTVDDPLPHQVASYVNAGHAALGAPAINWSRVAALRVCLIARSARPVPAGDNSREDLGTYQPCDTSAAPVTNNDGYLRRAYITTIQLRNMRPALPSDYCAGCYPWEFIYEN
jgi:type IV pilus assembly protein PilW